MRPATVVLAWLLLTLRMVSSVVYLDPEEEELNETVICTNDHMEVIIPSAFFLNKVPPVYVWDLHLNDPECRGVEVGDDYVFSIRTNLSDCGTIMTSDDTHIMFMNTIHNNHSEIITRNYINITFVCRYPVNYIVQQPNGENMIRVDIRTITLNTEDGNFSVSMLLYKDEAFQDEWTTVPSLTLDDNIFVKVYMIPALLMLRMERCWATPTSDPYSNVQYNFIRNRYVDTFIAHPETGLFHHTSSRFTRALLKSEIREFVASRAGQTTTPRAGSCDSCLRGHMGFTSTAVHVLDNRTVFGAVSNSTPICPVLSNQQTLSVLKNGQGPEATFRIQMFKFVGSSYTNVFLHCNVQICHNGPGLCQPNCSSEDGLMRLRRDIPLSHTVSYGPIRRQPDESGKSNTSSGGVPPVATFILAGLLVVLLLITGVFGRLWLRSRHFYPTQEAQLTLSNIHHLSEEPS